MIGRLRQSGDLSIDTWLMSCRVLGRQVEPTTLNLIAAEAKALGAQRLVGEYIPSAKNGMVREHYPRLGFAPCGDDGRYALDLKGFVPRGTFVELAEEPL